MSVSAYLNPDFTWGKKLFFLLVTFATLFVFILIILGIEKLMVPKDAKNYEEAVKDRQKDQIQRLFEMIIAGTSVMLFSCSYVIINHISTLVSSGAASANSRYLRLLLKSWSEGKDFMLLLLICISCVVNTLLDKLIIPLDRLSKEEKATMRMLGMFYVIIILMYLNYIGDESQYGPVMMYYFGLMIGRFVYFDASFMDFLEALKNVFFNLPFLVACLFITGGLCLFGFNAGFFLERNYYIVGIMYAHLFMLVCIFVIHWGYRIYAKISQKGTD